MAWDIGADHIPTATDTALTVNACAFASAADAPVLNELRTLAGVAACAIASAASAPVLVLPHPWDIGADKYPGINKTLGIDNAVLTLTAAVPSFIYGAPPTGIPDIGAYDYALPDSTHLAPANCDFGLASDSPAPILGPWSADFAGISQQILYKFEVFDGAAWQDLTSLEGVNYLKPGLSLNLGGAGVSPEPIAASWSATIANDGGIFHPNHPTSTYATLFQIGRKVRISVGRMHYGVPYYWQRMIGYMDAPKFSHGSRTVALSGCDYTKLLVDTNLRSPSNYWGECMTISTVATSETYAAELYAAADAMDQWSEANNETGWTVVGGTFTSVSETGGGSIYAAQLYKNTTYAVGYAYRTLALSLEAGKTYEVSFKYKRTGGSNCSLSCTVSDTQSMMGRVRGLAANIWSTATFHFDATSSCNPIVLFRIDSQIGNANDFRIDQLSVREVTGRLNTRYPLPAEANDVYFAVLDGMPIWYGDDNRGWFFDKASRVLYFADNTWAVAGIDNLKVYYFTTQTMVNVVADILVTAGMYADQAMALAAMDYTDPGVSVNDVWFEAGTSALIAIQMVCERCDYRFWFDAHGVPCFKPAPVIGKAAFSFETVGDLADVSDSYNLDGSKNHIVITGADQAAFSTTEGIAPSSLKGEALDAASIALYLEKTDSISNQLFDDQGAIDDMCATLLAEYKTPKLYADLQIFANVVPLEVGDTIRWKIALGENYLNIFGIIRGISISGPSMTYKCEVTSGKITVADQEIVVDQAFVGHSTSDVSVIPIGVATTLTVASGAVSSASGSITLTIPAASEQYIEHDAMDTLVEVDGINPHWIGYNATIDSIDDTDGGSTYVGLILHDSGPGASYVHSSRVCDAVNGQAYNFVIHYRHAVGMAACDLRLYQQVGANLMQVGISHSMGYSNQWHTLSFSLTAIATAPLQARLSFSTTGGEDGDELRVDGISIKTA